MGAGVASAKIPLVGIHHRAVDRRHRAVLNKVAGRALAHIGCGNAADDGEGVYQHRVLEYRRAVLVGVDGKAHGKCTGRTIGFGRIHRRAGSSITKSPEITGNLGSIHIG